MPLEGLPMSFDSWTLGPALRAAIQKNKCPSASIAIYRSGVLYEAAHGVLNAETGVDATVDSLYHIASITKPITATIAMQLVDEGKLDLDAPVTRYLPEFTAADRAAAKRVTVRQLTTHQSGIDGDFFHETSRGEDRIARLLDAGRELPQLHPLGEGLSYNNYAFCVLGRILEVIEGADFDVIWRRRISDRLGTPSLLTLREDALRYRVAVGHSGGPDGFKVPKSMYLAGSSGPAGGTAMAKARDLISFALMHLNGGVAQSGERLLSPASVKAMQFPHSALPAQHMATHFGLAWMIFDWGGQYLFGHDGASVFQRSYLRIHPASRTVVSLLCNGGDAGGLFRDMAGPVFESAGAHIPPVPQANDSLALDLTQYTGVYRRRSAVFEVSKAGSGLQMTSEWTDTWASELYGKQGPFPLRPAAQDRFLWCVPGLAEPGLVHFLNPRPGGQFGSLHSGFRVNHRVD
jgi:CubicO group peptidase (beta-lactamase class C family)